MLDPFSNTLFLFCGRRKDRIKGLYREGDGFILVYKRLEAFLVQAQRITELEAQVDRLMEAIRLSQSKRFGASSEKRQMNEEELCEQLGS